jgi:hypothetical protein
MRTRHQRIKENEVLLETVRILLDKEDSFSSTKTMIKALLDIVDHNLEKLKTLEV